MTPSQQRASSESKTVTANRQLRCGGIIDEEAALEGFGGSIGGLTSMCYLSNHPKMDTHY